MTVFLRMLGISVEDKPAELVQAVNALRNLGTAHPAFPRVIFERAPEAFSAVPGSPFAYWTSQRVLDCFEQHAPVETAGRHAAAGASTKDNLRFVRTLWEVAPRTVGTPQATACSWVPIGKGGSHSRYYSDVHLVVRWANDGRELKVAAGAWRAAKGWGDHWRAELHNSEFYGRPGVTWPVRSQKGFSARALGVGAIFENKGPTVFVPSDDDIALLALLALMNSRLFEHLVSVQMAFGAYEVGVIQRTPLVSLDLPEQRRLAALARNAWRLRRMLDAVNETSSAFLLPPGLNEKVTGLDRDAVERKLAAIQHEIDEVAYELYGIDPEDRAAIDATSKGAFAPSREAEAEESDASDDDDFENEAPVGSAVGMLISWLVGIVFGRFDPRLATGNRAAPPDPEPFDALPSRSPAMWLETEVREVAPRDIVVDDPGHEGDLAKLVAETTSSVHLAEPENLRSFLAKDFFSLHIKMYSKSRRKAPMYWQLATPSASYSVWLYIHAFSRDSLFRVQNDYAVPKLAHEERRLDAMTRELREKASAALRKELAAQENFVDELRTFLEEVKRVAPFWNPNLDDGVIINFAPLWRLVPHHRPWQKELKATWDALRDGKYDWAHLAMHFWPERVVPKCATDRSFAIAHRLEVVFWVEGSDGKWTARKTPTRTIEELVRERTSPAVKAALKSLLEAPTATGNGARGRAGRRRTAEEGGSR